MVVCWGSTINGDLASANITSSELDLGHNTGKEAHAFIDKDMPGRKVKIATVAFKSLLPEQSDRPARQRLPRRGEGPGRDAVVSQQDAWLDREGDLRWSPTS